MIRRRFADLPTRQVHYREAGEGRALLMLHPSPGSSKQLEGKIGALAQSRRVVAPDTPGNGDSSPLPMAAPQIADYAAATIAFLDAIGLEQCDLYGSHTGANIALHLASRAPSRFGKVVLDGIGLFSHEEREIYLARYAPPITLDHNGSQFNRAFMFCRDQYLFWPWFETAAENRRAGGLPTPEVLHDWALEVCKSATTYHLGYRASFADDAEAQLRKIAQDVLLLVAQNDPLLDGTKVAAGLPASAQLAVLGHSASPTYNASFAEAVETFLGPV